MSDLKPKYQKYDTYNFAEKRQVGMKVEGLNKNYHLS
jgi:hypothetical protein